MKLLTKTTLYFVTISLFIFFILGIGIYQLVKRLEDQKVNQELNDQRHRLIHKLEHMNTDFKNTQIVWGDFVQVNPVLIKNQPEIRFSDTLIFDALHNNFMPYRRLSYYTTFDGALYRMSIFKSLYESNHVVEQVALTILAAIMLFLLTVYFLYRYFFGHIWSDFFAIINRIEHYNLSSPVKVDFETSTIIEFNQLSDVLKKMINRINADFEGMKEFTGNLTHEIQTPLAVIRSKTDLLIQDKDVSEHQMIVATEINAETVRLSKLVKALNLLTKLEHSQFSEKQQIDIDQLITVKLEAFDDFIESRKISKELKITGKPNFEMSPELADILFGNLIKNAVKHNIEGGVIIIEVDGQSFRIKNTGNAIDFDPEILFNRFVKFSKSSDSLGIGLSIVKKICDYYDFKIVYQYITNLHELTINLNNEL